MRFDLFDFYRFMLMVVVGVHLSLRLITFIWRWQAYEQREWWAPLARRYFLVHLLRIRFRRFAFDLLQIVGLLILLLWLVRLHLP